jgi:hypothetical protein
MPANSILINPDVVCFLKPEMISGRAVIMTIGNSVTFQRIDYSAKPCRPGKLVAAPVVFRMKSNGLAGFQSPA